MTPLSSNAASLSLGPSPAAKPVAAPEAKPVSAEAVARLSLRAREALAELGARCSACRGPLENCDSRSWALGDTRHTLLRCATCGGSELYPKPAAQAQGAAAPGGPGRGLPRFLESLSRLLELRGLLAAGPLWVAGAGASELVRAARWLRLRAAAIDEGALPSAASAAAVISLHGLEEAADALAETARLAAILRPGGVLVAAVDHAQSGARRGPQLAADPAQQAVPRLRQFTEDGLRALLRAAGLASVSVRGRDRWEHDSLAQAGLVRAPRPLISVGARIAALAASAASRTARTEPPELVAVARKESP